MKYLSLIAFMFTCCSAFCQSELLTVGSEDKSFSVQYPSTWKSKVEQYDKTAIVSLTAPGENRIKTIIQRAKLPPNTKTLDQLIAQVVPEIKKQYDIKTLLIDKRIGNRHMLSYEFKAKDKTIKVKSYVWVDGGFMINSTFAAEPSDFTTYANEAEAIIKSVGPFKAGNANATSNNSQQTNSQNNMALVDADCSAISGFNIIAKVPAGITPIEKYGTIRLSDAKKFQVQISKIGSPIEKEKKSLSANTMNVLKKYVVDESNGIIYESEAMGQTQYHFKYILNSGEENYYFEDSKGVQYDLASVQLMYKAAKESTIKGAKSGNKSANENTQSQNTATTVAAAATTTAAIAGNDKTGVVAAGAQAAPAVINKFNKKNSNKNGSNDDTENGPYELKDDAGNVAEKGQYKEGKKTGKWQYFEKGKLTEELDYKDGKKDGKKVTYYSNGNKQYEESYKDGNKDGEYKAYSMTTGDLTEIKSYQNDKLEGAYKKYSGKGTLLEEGNYKDGKKDGEWKKYDINGKLTKTQNYKEGKLEE